MRDLTESLKKRKIDFKKIIEYGFKQKDNNYLFEQNICKDKFKVIVNFTKTSQTAKVIDLALNEEYLLVDVKQSTGEFVGKVKEEYENILNDIISKCCSPNYFQSSQAEKIIEYVKEKYHDELEYLWEKAPDCAIWRNKKNNKWYGLIMVISKEKLGLDSTEPVEIIDLRYAKEDSLKIIDNQKIFPGYHMNKKSWITIKLDDSVDLDEIYKLIDNSFQISSKK